MKTGIELITEERDRQRKSQVLGGEGWTKEHDDSHEHREMARAARCYIGHYISFWWRKPKDYKNEKADDNWPWFKKWWKPKDPIKDLVRAGALIAAEIDRLSRLEQSNKPDSKDKP